MPVLSPPVSSTPPLYHVPPTALQPCHAYYASPLLEEMAAKGIAPNTVTYNILIAACERGGQWQKAVQVTTHGA
eukprot:1009218-Prorocentrum_minimum.AAC.3